MEATAPGMDAAPWGAQEQAALQSALRLFPASIPKDERWQRIAQHVGRPKRDCVQRYKAIAAEIQARSGATAAASEGSGSAGALGGGGARDSPPRADGGAIVDIVRHAPPAASATPKAAVTKARENLMSPRSSGGTEAAVDPISLEPLADLPYPPFILRADPARSTQNDAFDGNMLASYLVSTGRFEHPFSRRQLRRDECIELDLYLRRHRLPHLRVCYAFDHRDEFAPDGSGNQVRRAVLLRKK
jgi:hypothetical protein